MKVTGPYEGPRGLPAGGLEGGQAGIIRKRILFASGQVREQQGS
jgi:hypothetical protein